MRVYYGLTHTGYYLRGLTAIARACGVSRWTLAAWIRDWSFPVAPIADETGSVKLTTSYGLLDAWLFAHWLASREALREALADVCVTAPTEPDAHDVLLRASGAARRQQETVVGMTDVARPRADGGGEYA